MRRDSLDSDSTEALMIEADRELTITSRPADHREYVNGHSGKHRLYHRITGLLTGGKYCGLIE